MNWPVDKTFALNHRHHPISFFFLVFFFLVCRFICLSYAAYELGTARRRQGAAAAWRRLAGRLQVRQLQARVLFHVRQGQLVVTHRLVRVHLCGGRGKIDEERAGDNNNINEQTDRRWRRRNLPAWRAVRRPPATRWPRGAQSRQTFQTKSRRPLAAPPAANNKEKKKKKKKKRKKEEEDEGGGRGRRK